MGFLGFGKKKDFIDLGDRYRKQKEREEEMAKESREASQEPSTRGGFDFLGNMASSSNEQAGKPSEESIDISAGENKKKRLAKRLVEMTARLEDVSNQIYHLQQRIEVLERKLDVNKF